MVEIKRDNNLNFEVYSIRNDTGSFKIFYFYAMDLCFTCDSTNNDSDTYSVVISPNDKYIYTLIDEVYDSVSNNQPFKHLKYDFEAKNLVFPDKSDYSKKLFKEGIIEWHSDDYAYSVGSILFIKKDDDKYIITFQKSKAYSEGVYPYTEYTVTISNNSRYSPYNITFMNMFNKLREYDFLINQVNINSYSSNGKTNVRKKE